MRRGAKCTPIAELVLDLMGLGAVDQEGEIEAGDVVAGEDVGVGDLQEGDPCTQHLLFRVVRVHVGAGDGGAALQLKDRRAIMCVSLCFASALGGLSIKERKEANPKQRRRH